MCQNIMITLLLLYSYRPVCFPTYPYTTVLYRFQGIQYKAWCVSKHDYRCIAPAVESPFPLLTCLHTKINTLEFIANYCCTAVVVTWIKISRLYLHVEKRVSCTYSIAKVASGQSYLYTIVSGFAGLILWSLYEHTVAVLISQLFSTLTATYPDRRVFFMISLQRGEPATTSHMIRTYFCVKPKQAWTTREYEKHSSIPAQSHEQPRPDL